MIDEATYSGYVQSLVRGDRSGCQRIVEGLLEGDIPVTDLYEGLFQRSLYEVGSLWEHNRISVAVEHLATAITERMLSLVYPKLFGADHCGKRAVVTCTPGEYHQIGARMVADVFELYGWDGYYLGADTPRDDLVLLISSKSPDLVALSSSLTENLASAWSVLDLVVSSFPTIPVIVGGQAYIDQEAELSSRFPTVRHVGSLKSLEELIGSEGNG